MKKRVEEPVQLQSAQVSEVVSFQGTSIEILVEVFRRNVNLMNPFSGRESALHVMITNQGENEIQNAIVEARCSDDLQLVDSGALFGSGRRHVRLPNLKPTRKIKYKLALRPSPTLTTGSLYFEIKSANWKSSEDLVLLKLDVVRKKEI